MAVPVELEIFMKDLTKAGLQSVGKNVDDVENQTLKLIDALKLVRAEQIKQLEANKQAGKNYTQEAANVQALTGQINGLKAGLKDLQKTKEEVAKTPSIDIDTEAVTRKTNNLKMQFSQVARELPSLAMGPQMFILAISNNLPMLADAIADVRKQNELLAASGQKGVPVWKQLGKALLSPQTALIALISLGIVYGKEIGQWIKKTFSFSDSLETLSESQKRYQEALNKGNAEAQNSITRLRVLYNAATDEAESTETRKKAIVALKKEYPDYFNKMSDENIMLGKSADAYERLTVSILAASRARASMKFLDENNEKIISLEQKITQEYVKRDAAQKELDKRIEKRNSIDREQNPDLYSGAQMMVGAASGRVDEIDKVIAEYRNQIYQLQKHNKEIELGIDVAALTTDFSGGSGGTGKKEKTDYASQLADARVKAQQTTEKLRLQIMVEGIAKRKALARQEYDEQLADIDKQERDTIAKMDKARKQGENIPQSQYDAVRQKSQEQRILVQQLYNDQLLQIDKEYNDKVTQSFIDYNKQYGTYQEKRLAIAMDYARKIAAAETEGDEYKKKALEQERKESLSALDFSELKDSIDWEVVFGNLSKVSKQELQKVKLQLKQFKQSPEYKNMTVEQQKIVNEAISSIQENIIEQGGILGDLPEQLKELASAQNELEAAQKEYNDALANGTEVEIEAARKKKTQATQNVINSQSNVNLSAEKAQNNISTVIDSISNLGEAGASLSSFGNSIGTLIDVFSESEHKIGGIVGAILGLPTRSSNRERVVTTSKCPTLTRRTARSSATRRKPTNREQWRNGRRTAAAPCRNWAICSTARWRKRTAAGTSTLLIPEMRKMQQQNHPLRKPSNPPQLPTATSIPRSATSMSSRRTTTRKWTNCWSVSPRWNRNWKPRKARHPLWMIKWHSWKSPTSWRRSTWAVRTVHSHLSDRRQNLTMCRKPERTRLHLSGR